MSAGSEDGLEEHFEANGAAELFFITFIDDFLEMLLEVYLNKVVLSILRLRIYPMLYLNFNFPSRLAGKPSGGFDSPLSLTASCLMMLGILRLT
jgi:hypothetical protein